MQALLDVILIVLELFTWAIVAVAVLSWLVSFDILNLHNSAVRSVWNGLNALVEPPLRPIRRFVPMLGGLDISPLILLLVIYFIERVIKYNIYPYVVGY
jgi:YggT family protein